MNELKTEFKKKLYWNAQLIKCILMGTVAISAISYLGWGVQEVLGGHH